MPSGWVKTCTGPQTTATHRNTPQCARTQHTVMRADSSMLDGLWSAVAYAILPPRLSTPRESPQLAKTRWPGVTRTDVSVDPADGGPRQAVRACTQYGWTDTHASSHVHGSPEGSCNDTRTGRSRPAHGSPEGSWSMSGWVRMYASCRRKARRSPSRVP